MGGWGTSHTSRPDEDALTVENKVEVQSIPYLYDVAKGHVAGATPFTKLGFNGDVDNAEEDVWTIGGKYVFPTGATAMEVVSASPNDAAAGSGIQQVRIAYLDVNFVEHSEIVTLNGVGAVAMVGQPFRVNAVRAFRVGVNKIAAGQILVRGAGAGPTYRAISLGQTRGRSLVYTVPFGKNLFLASCNISGVNTAANHYALYTLRATYDDALDAKVPFFEPYFELGVENSTEHIVFETPIKVPATCDVVMSVISDNAASNEICSAGLRGWLEPV